MFKLLLQVNRLFLKNLTKQTYVLQILIENDCVEALTFVLLDLESRTPVLSEVTATLAVMADEGIHVIQYHSPIKPIL